MRTHDMSDMHLEEGTLQAVLDGELPGDDHLASCEACRARLDLLRGRGERVRAILLRTDWPLPEMALPTTTVVRALPVRRSWVDARPLRVAAAVAGLLALATLATPARAWIAAWAERAWAAVAGDPAGAPVGPVARPTPQRTVRRTVEYSPAGPELRISLALPQRAGALVLERGGGDAVRIEVLGEGEADVLVLPEGVRIGNAPERTGAYRVAVPSAVEVVRVDAGDGRVIELRRADIPAAGYSVPLGRGR